MRIYNYYIISRYTFLSWKLIFLNLKSQKYQKKCCLHNYAKSIKNFSPIWRCVYLAEIPPHPSVIRKWLRSGDIEKLEAVVIQGQGHKLLGEYTTDVRVKAFLKTIPAYLVSGSRTRDYVCCRIRSSEISHRLHLDSDDNFQLCNYCEPNLFGYTFFINFVTL